jgi:hypothetical protein
MKSIKVTALSTSKKIATLVTAIAATGAMFTSQHAHADPVVATACNAGACAQVSPVAAGVFIAVGILRPTIERNFEASKQESGLFNQTIRATIGVSIGDIERYGIFGGPNSFFRKPFG